MFYKAIYRYWSIISTCNLICTNCFDGEWSDFYLKAGIPIGWFLSLIDLTPSDRGCGRWKKTGLVDSASVDTEYVLHYALICDLCINNTQCMVNWSPYSLLTLYFLQNYQCLVLLFFEITYIVSYSISLKQQQLERISMKPTILFFIWLSFVS